MLVVFLMFNCYASKKQHESHAFLHVVAFSKKLHWLAQTKVISLKMQLHAVNASWKRLSQFSLKYNLRKQYFLFFVRALWLRNVFILIIFEICIVLWYERCGSIKKCWKYFICIVCYFQENLKFSKHPIKWFPTQFHLFLTIIPPKHYSIPSYLRNFSSII